MLITVEINSCKECRHRDHSGAFTQRPGETKNNPYIICGHPKATEHTMKGQLLREIEEPYHYKHRVIDDDYTIPNWCPLKGGEQY